MALQIQHMTVEEFDVYAELPQNRDKILEYIGGEVVEVPSNAFASHISQIIAGELYIFLKGKDLGQLTGEAGGYQVSGERYTPDVAYISKAKQGELAKHGYNPLPPDLAVEVDFPSTYESQRELRTKVVNYLAAGTVVWVVLPETKEVEVYSPGQPRKLLRIDHMLDGDDLLPGFTLALKTIFAD